MALIVLAVLLVHAYVKYRRGILPELLWGCNLATVCVIGGLWRDRPALTGAGFLWLACVGDPWNLYQMVAARAVSVVSAVMHVVSTIASFLSVRRKGLHPASPLIAVGIFVFIMPLSRALTPPGLNVNFAHARVPQIVTLFPGVWEYRAVFTGMMLLPLLAGDRLFARYLGRPAVSAPDEVPSPSRPRTQRPIARQTPRVARMGSGLVDQN